MAGYTRIHGGGAHIYLQDDSPRRNPRERVVDAPEFVAIKMGRIAHDSPGRHDYRAFTFRALGAHERRHPR
jgi:hypothetical protein